MLASPFFFGICSSLKLRNEPKIHVHEASSLAQLPMSETTLPLKLIQQIYHPLNGWCHGTFHIHGVWSTPSPIGWFLTPEPSTNQIIEWLMSLTGHLEMLWFTQGFHIWQQYICSLQKPSCVIHSWISKRRFFSFKPGFTESMGRTSKSKAIPPMVWVNCNSGLIVINTD